MPYTYTVPHLNGATAIWSVTGGTILGSNSSDSVLIQFNSSATPPYIVSVHYEIDNCIGEQGILEVNPLIPVVTFDNAPTPVCSSATETYSIQSATNLDFINWTITPANAGSIVSGQGTESIEINWNNGNMNAVVRATYRNCGIESFIETTVGVNFAPTIAINAVANACSGSDNPVAFQLLGIDPALSGTITWDFGDGTTAQGQNVTHPFLEPLTEDVNYTVTVTVQSPNGCINPATATHIIQVAPSPVITLDHSPSLNLCSPSNQPEDYTFTIVFQGGWAGTETIQWFHNGAPISNTTSTLTIDASAPVSSQTGNYYAIVTNVNNCSAQTDLISVYNQCPTGGGCTVLNDITVDVTVNCGSVTLEAYPDGSPDFVQFILSNGAPFNKNYTIPFTDTFTGLAPGEYTVRVEAGNDTFNGTCWNPEFVTFIIPYEPDFKFNVSCNNNGTYNLTLLDHSRYYDPTPTGSNNPITSYEFTTDGSTWTTGTLVNGVMQAQFTELSPDVYNVGIRIAGNPFTACQKIEPLTLDAFPDATFTIEGGINSICEGVPVTFTPNTLNPEWTYLWTFIEDGSENSNPVTQKTFDFNSGTTQTIILTVINRFGCSSNSGNLITIIEEKIDGILVADQNQVCIGTPVTLSYDNDPLSQIPNPELPSSLEWYHEVNTNLVGTGMTLTVTQPGYYFAYGYNASGCLTRANINPITVTMIPAPQPVIEGTTVQCLGTDIVLSTPLLANTSYYWSVNGSALPAFNGQNTISFTPSTIGNYSFTLVAESIDSQGNPCQSLPVLHEVEVLQSPWVPQIEIVGVQCDPYSVQVQIANPQADVIYYWSNGATGNSTTILHDGPLQVRAELFDCDQTSEIDLPVDLKLHEWLFPKGCYDYCKIEEGNPYIIGPLLELNWAWLNNNEIIANGNGLVDAITVYEGVYQQNLDNNWCHELFGNSTIKANECAYCDLTIEPTVLGCETINNTTVYQVSFYINNNSNNLSLTFSTPNGEGFFNPSTIQAVASGNTIYNGYFIPNTSFTGGTITVSVEGTDGIEVNCRNTFELYLNCEGSPKLASPKNSVLLSPNPTQDSVTVLYELAQEGAVTLELTDGVGRALITKQLFEAKGSVELNLSSYPSGVYPVRLLQKGKVVYYTYVIKK